MREDDAENGGGCDFNGMQNGLSEFRRVFFRRIIYIIARKLIDVKLEPSSRHFISTRLFIMNREPYSVRFRSFVAELSARHSDNTAPCKKRNYVDSFGERDYEMERYGQEIGTDFFTHNIGHGVLQETK
jgi:hypothetical protein